MKQVETSLWRTVLIVAFKDMEDFVKRFDKRKKISAELKASVYDTLGSYNNGGLDNICKAAGMPPCDETHNFSYLLKRCRDIVDLWSEANAVKLMYREENAHIFETKRVSEVKNHFIAEQQVFNNYVEARR